MIGLDIGTRCVKMIMISGDKVTKRLFDTIDFYRQYIKAEDEQFQIDFERLGFDPQAVRICATGYGREMAKLSGIKKISEIIAHAKGAVVQTKLQDFLLIDLGGQDSKIIDVKGGQVVDFRTNDRCAASTGRYLENMANILGMSLEEISSHYEEPASLSSVCAVFGESELLSKMSSGVSAERLAAGVNYALVNRLHPHIKHFSPKQIVLCGGVSMSIAIRNIISNEYGISPIVPKYPQYNGSLGSITEIYTDEAKLNNLLISQ